MRNPIKVLITGAGGAGTIEIIKSLKKIGDYHIIACDANPNAYGLRIADKGYVLPMGNEKFFQTVAEGILRNEKPDYIVPLVDEEIMKFWNLHISGKIVTPSPLFCAMVLDKYETYQILKKYHLPTPNTILGNHHCWLNYPIILKPRKGHGSKNQRELDFPAGHRFTDDYILQEKFFGKEFTISVVVNLNGKLLSIIPKEVIDKRGITIVGITRNVPEIESLCKELVEKLNPMGPFNVQLMMDKNNQPWIFEINPRYSTTVALTIAAGVNEVDAVIRSAEGEKIDTPMPFIPNLIMNRYYTQEYYLE